MSGESGGAMGDAGGHPLSSEQTQRSLWLGDLAPWMDENFLFGLFAGTNQLLSVKLIRNRTTGLSEGYAFLEFRTHEAADSILKTFNGQPIPGTDQVFRLNWAAYGVGRAAPSSEDHSLFVGDLAPDVSDMILQEYFRQFYPSVRSAKVITDAATGRSKGYGFVRFGAEPERDRALTEMNAQILSNRPIRVSLATAKKNAHTTTASAVQAPHPSDFDPTNTTLFIGGLSNQVTEEQLRAVFARFGDIIYVKIPQGKGCGFVQFVLRTAAERAMATMNAQVLGNSAIRISWGRSSSRAANQAAAQQLGAAAAFPGLPGAFPGFDPSFAAAAAAQGYQLSAMAGMGPGGGLPGADHYAAVFAAQPQASHNPEDLYQAYQQSAALGQGANGFGSSSALAALAARQAGGGQPPHTAGALPPAPASPQANGAPLPQPAPALNVPAAGAELSGGGSAASGGAQQDSLDPAGAGDVGKLNAAFAAKHNPALLGAHMFASLSLS